MSPDADREAFRILRNSPALWSMELLWRWSFGLGLLALTVAAYVHLRPALMFTEGEALNLQDPAAFAESATNMIAPVLPLLAKTAAQVFCVASVLWAGISALGRGVITRTIVRRFAKDYGVAIAPDAPRWASFALLQCARVLMLLILVIGYLGGAYLGSLVNEQGDNVLAASLIVLSALTFAGLVWSYVNWILSLAPIFVARDALSPLDATVEAIAFIRRRFSQLKGIAIWNSALRGMAATVITLAGVFTAVSRGIAPWALTVLLVLETLAYLVISDILLLVRLASYASVAVRERSIAPELESSPDRSENTIR
jgi:hypothetical protein